MEIYNLDKKLIFNGADLRGADLRWTDLRGANLWRADLSEANLRNKKYIHILGSKDPLYFLDTLQIWYEIHSLEFWLVNHKEIGDSNKYTTAQIEEYYEYIKICGIIKGVDRYE